MWLPWRKRKAPTSTIHTKDDLWARLIPERTLPELLKRYEYEKLSLSMLSGGRPNKLSDDDHGCLREIERRIIALQTDQMQREVLTILIQHGFNLAEFFGKQTWQNIIEESIQDIVHFLHYGMILPSKTEQPRLFRRGDELFLWMLEQARDGAEADRMSNISTGLSHGVKEGSLLGRKFSREEAQEFGHRIVVVVIGEFAKQMRVLVDIFCEVEGGEQFIRDCCAKAKLTPIP
jgi:hypothetical protein